MTPDVDHRLDAIEDDLGRRYLYADDDTAVESGLDALAAAIGDTADAVIRSRLRWSRGMLLHYRAIDLDPVDRAGLDVAGERACFAAALIDSESVPGDHTGRARALFGLALVEQVLERDLGAARAHIEGAFEQLDADGATSSLLRSEVVRHLGFDRLLRSGEPDPAVELLSESLRIRAELTEQGWMCSGHVALSFALRNVGREGEAVEHSRRAVQVAKALSLRTCHVDAARREHDAAVRAHAQVA